MLDNLTISYIKEIQEASLQNRLVAFVGAGASCDAGVPLWNDLVNQMASVLPQDIQTKYDNLQLAQLVRETSDVKTYYASVRKYLLQNVTCPNAIHDGILELNPTCIITTNYDTLLEEAALKNNQQFWVVSKDSDLPKNHGERLLIKMHGDLDNENIVLTENDYYDYSRNFPLIRSYVVSQFASKVVVFIGFSLSDINLKYILREIQSELGSKMQKAFLLTQDLPSWIEMNNLKERGVNVLSITQATAQDIVNELKLELRPDLFLSERGKTLVNQLSILKLYRNSDKLIDLAIDFFDNQIQDLAVSGRYMMYAFPKDKRKGFRFEGHNIELPYQYRDEFLFHFSSRRNIIHLWRKYGIKLQKLRNCLLDSDVYIVNNVSIYSKCSGRKRAINIAPSVIQSYSQMDINDFVGRIKSLRERSLAYNMGDLELPFALFLSGYYYDAYLIYSMLAPEMWKRRKYILFFVCLYNKHSVTWPAIRSIQDRKDIDCDEIKRTYYSCDLTKELNKLPLSECAYALFSDLIYNHQLSDSLIITSNTAGKIAAQRKRAEERTGWSLNSNINKVLTSFVGFFDFCVDNYLIIDNNEIGTQFYSAVARGLFDSVLTPSDRAQSKLDALNIPALYVILFKLIPKDLKELMAEVVGNKKMPVTDDFIEKLRGCVKNIFIASESVIRHENLPIKAHVLRDWLHNILLIVPHITGNPVIEHLDALIARLWNLVNLQDRVKEVTEYFLTNAPSEEAAEIVLYEVLESVCHDADAINLIVAISESTRNSEIKWDKNRVMKGVKFQGSAGVAAAVLHATGDQLADTLKKWILDKAKTLYDIVYAQSLTEEKLLSPDMFTKFKSSLYDNQNPFEKQNFNSLLANYYNNNGDKYADIKECIVSIAKELPELKFAINPLAWSNFEDIDCDWMVYITEDLYDDILKNVIARRKLKEYCEKVSWGNEIKEIIWKKL